MPLLRLRAYLNRRTLKNLLRLIRKRFHMLAMSQPNSEPELQSSSAPRPPPPFDPMEPSVPISYPIKTLEDLESQSYFNSFHYPFNKASVALQSGPSYSLPNRRRLLVCHDMEGGYVDDKWVQGGTNPEAYAIWHWYLIDVFVYFSHSLVALPPPCWINTAHRHGVKVLGTFMAEWDEGRVICDRLLSTKESAHLYAERLAELADSLGFDGWLMNIEVKLDIEQIPLLKEFVSHLNETMHSLVPGSLVIWYDSVTIHGDLHWQDQLNEKNKPFFDSCDGIFVNYSWKENYPRLSAAIAGDRKFDVYMGIDVFGRGTYGGGQWNTNVALDVLKKNDVSAAIFAPGWVYETKQPPNFQSAQNHWWALVEKSWGILQNYPKMLPFYTNFDQGRGYHFSIDGTKVSDDPWCNISCQGFQVRSEGDSQLGLSLHFSSTMNESTSILLASGDFNQFSSKFSKVIPTQRLEKPGNSFGWVLQEGSIALESGDMLTEIHAVCYRSKYESSARSSVKYFAELGHLTIRTSHEKKLDFLASSSWLVDGQFIKWACGSRGSKTLSVKIVWKLKHGTSTAFSNYNIYVKKVTKQVEEVAEYLGTAHVEAFYVSDLVVPSETSSLKFIVQMCAADGTCQNLDDSPTFTVDAEGPL
ncbi:cytosolic endo-beta-N-acetylglucosaminidase 1 isoform X2 [Juglans microcarpa x Juglans regia]|uniref:cytosolic endo-beta-N-acetylglucosaminidase 1 isoform X2 n=1 Tax=Juglans microcarpa x Juglans regia TaxID=2249226 RepID=UPI001B7EE9FC|nr:cytosolic endo-beta-N-acetylglucosaminidase 1 isoform X2 [Juglans microcarpa x Juglans regia]